MSLNRIDGVVITGAVTDQSNTQIVGDDLGGAIIVWEDYRRGTNHDIYIQKMESDEKFPMAP